MSSIHFLFLTLLFHGCSMVHNVTLGEFDYEPGYKYTPFEIKVSEVGFDLQEAAGWVDTLGGHGDGRYQKFADIIALFQMGPRTGKPVYSDYYSQNLYKAVFTKCPSGNVTGLLTIRETASYPVVSGEIIKIRGYCIRQIAKKKTSRKRKKS